EELLALDAVHPALAGHGPPAQVREHDLGDLGVVPDHVRLGGPGAGVENLVEAAQAQAAALDDDVRPLGHGARPPQDNSPRQGETVQMRAIWTGSVAFGL